MIFFSSKRYCLFLTHFMVLILLILLFPCLVWTSPIWNPSDGVVLKQDYFYELSNTSIASQGDLTLIVISDTDEIDRNLHGILYNSQGEMVWSDQVTIASGDFLQASPFVKADGQGNWFITYRQDGQLYVQKINDEGELLWQEEGHLYEQGVPVYLLLSHLQNPIIIDVVPDNSGGCYILFTTNDFGNFYYQTSLILQHISSEGNICDGWLLNGITLTDTLDIGYDVQASIAKKGDDGVWVNYGVNSAWSVYNYYLAAIDYNGNFEFDSPFQVTTSDDFEFCYVSVVDDGRSGCYTLLYDGLGFANIQRYDLNGIARWAEGGENITEYRIYSDPIKMIAGQDSTAIIAWAGIDNSESADSVVIQKIGGDDTIIRHFGATGSTIYYSDVGGEINKILSIDILADGSIAIPVIATPNYSNYPVRFRIAISDESGGLMEFFPVHDPPVIYEDYSKYQLPVSIDENGVLTSGWAKRYSNGVSQFTVYRADAINRTYLTGETGQILRSEQGHKCKPENIISQNDQSIIVYRDLSYADHEKIKLLRINNNNGSSVGEEVSLFGDRINLYGGYRPWPKTSRSVVDDEGFVTIFARTPEPDGTYSDEVLLAQRVSPDGTLLWGDEGVIIGEVTYIGHTLVDAGGGCVISAWPVSNETENGVAVQMFNQYADPLWNVSDNSYLYLPTTSANMAEPVCDIIKIDANQWLMLIYETGSILNACSFNNDGEVIYNNEMINFDNERMLDYARTENGVFFLSKASNNPYMLNFIDFEGNSSWDEAESFYYSFASGKQQLCSSGENANSVWMLIPSVNNENEGAIFIQQFNENGEILFEPYNGIEFDGYQQCEIYVSPDNLAFLIFRDGAIDPYTSSLDYNIRLSYSVLDGDGNLLPGFEQGPQQFAYSAGNISDLNLVGDGEGGLLITWSDACGESSHLYAQRFDDSGNPVGNFDFKSYLPEQLVIANVYPNPFNNSTEVVVQLPETSLLQVKVFDILGREVATLTNRKYNPGQYSFVFKKNDLASGIYFVQASINGFACDVKKIVLMK